MNDTVRQHIEKTLSDHDVVLYMKGSRTLPRCGFSAQVVEILEHHQAKYLDVDVLSEPELRTGLKEFSGWPTFPQLYVKGRLVGGCDVVRELDQSGELTTLLGS